MPLTSIEMGGHVYRVELIRSAFERWSLVSLAQLDGLQGAAVALGRCLPELEVSGLWHSQAKGLGSLFAPIAGDALLERGCNPAEILTAGLAVIEALRESLVPTPDEVQETRGNSQAPTEELTP